MIVLDVSAASAIARKTKEGLALRSLMFSGEEVVAPQLFYSEAANAAWKFACAGIISDEGAERQYVEMVNFVDRFVDMRELAREALAESIACGHSAYDMFYLVLARRKRATLFTLDKRLNALCDELHVEHAYDVQLE